MNLQPDTLHDRITALADEWSDELIRGLPEASAPLHERVAALRAVLVETATAQPNADAVERADVVSLLDDAIRRVPKIGGAGAIYEAELLSVLRTARAALAAAQPVEPEPFMPGPGHAAFCGNEQPHARHRHPFPDSYDVCEGVPPVGPEPDERCVAEWCRENGLPLTFFAASDAGPDEREARLDAAAQSRIEAFVERQALVEDVYRILRTSNNDGRALAREVIDTVRRSRHEATYTVTAEQVEYAEMAVVDVIEDEPPGAFRSAETVAAQAVGAMLAALGVTVADTPTQAGDEA